MSRWQIKTTDSRTGNLLSTIEMPDLSVYGIVQDYRYESCYFPSSGHSDVLARYNTQTEAVVGHDALAANLFNGDVHTAVMICAE